MTYSPDGYSRHRNEQHDQVEVEVGMRVGMVAGVGVSEAGGDPSGQREEQASEAMHVFSSFRRHQIKARRLAPRREWVLPVTDHWSPVTAIRPAP
jgi:hypothetical protein